MTVDGDQWSILRDMLPYLWPAGHPGLKARVVLALIALVLSKVVTVATPYAFKYATDALTGQADVATTAITVVVFLVLGYLGVQPPEELRNLVAKIGTLLYFAFFMLMPWWSAMGEFKSAPDRVTFAAH